MNIGNKNEAFVEVLSLSNENLGLLRSKNIDFSPTGTYSEPALKNLWLALQDENQPLNSKNLADELIKLLEKELEIEFAHIFVPTEKGFAHPHLSNSGGEDSWVRKFWESKGSDKNEYPQGEDFEKFCAYLYHAVHQKIYKSFLSKNEKLEEAFIDFLVKKGHFSENSSKVLPDDFPNTLQDYENCNEFVQEQINLLDDQIAKNPSKKDALEKTKERLVNLSQDIKVELGVVGFIAPLLDKNISDAKKREIINNYFGVWKDIAVKNFKKDANRSDFFSTTWPDIELTQQARSKGILQNIPHIPLSVQQFCRLNFSQEGVGNISNLIFASYFNYEQAKTPHNSNPEQDFKKCKNTPLQYTYVFEGETLKKVIFTYALFRENADPAKSKIGIPGVQRLIYCHTFEIPEDISELENKEYYPGTFPEFKNSIHIYMNHEDFEQGDYPGSLANFVNLLNKKAKKSFRLQKTPVSISSKKTVPIAGLLGASSIVLGSIAIITAMVFLAILAPPLGLLVIGLGFLSVMLALVIIGGIGLLNTHQDNESVTKIFAVKAVNEELLEEEKENQSLFNLISEVANTPPRKDSVEPKEKLELAQEIIPDSDPVILDNNSEEPAPELIDSSPTVSTSSSEGNSPREKNKSSSSANSTSTSTGHSSDEDDLEGLMTTGNYPNTPTASLRSSPEQKFEVQEPKKPSPPSNLLNSH